MVQNGLLAERRGIGRPLGFDSGQVVESAMGAFWEQGYGATSLPDLEERLVKIS